MKDAILQHKSLEDQLEEYLEQKEIERYELLMVMQTPPVPLYRPRRHFDTDGLKFR